MIRLVLLLIVLTAIYVLLFGQKKPTFRLFARSFGHPLMLLGTVVIFLLIISGKLQWFFGVIAVAVSAVFRWLPSMLGHLLQITRWWHQFRPASDKFHERTGHQANSSRRGNALTEAEALAVLGLSAGASKEEITKAHRLLISKLHPDKGGSAYLAAKINLAKQVLMQGKKTGH